MNYKDIEISVILHPEEMPIKGNCSAVDEETDRETEKSIEEQLKAGNPWAWCIVEVRGEYKGLSASEFLGGCSYESEDDFKRGGYYEDMVLTVNQSIGRQVLAIVRAEEF